MDDIPNKILEKLQSLVAVKGENIMQEDLLLPEIRWAIDCTPLSEMDRKFAVLRYLEGKSSSKVMEELGWYSTNTFTRHNRSVWKKIVATIIRLVA